MSIVTLNDRGVRSVSAFGSLDTGSMIFIKKLTASSSGTLSFVNGASSVVLDSTYKEYVFTFKDIHPASDGKILTFQGSTNTGSSYGVTITSTFFLAEHNEDDSSAQLTYASGSDLAQSTSYKYLSVTTSNGADSCVTGHLRLFNPSSTTFVKHFIGRTNTMSNSLRSAEADTAGYFNTTSAIDAIQFKFDSGNIDAGDICLYGIL
jgi:hypothetical protein